MFTNRRPSGGTFYRRFSPTSFYALMAKAATDEQAAAMTQQWLLNPKHFAITVKGDHAGNSDANWVRTTACRRILSRPRFHTV